MAWLWIFLLAVGIGSLLGQVLNHKVKAGASLACIFWTFLGAGLGQVLVSGGKLFVTQLSWLTVLPLALLFAMVYSAYYNYRYRYRHE
ncbi:hypothetical protein CYJ29_07955 [Aerococcus loyolae]|uniref:Uncharacterized protein n=1 Tax=Aerococcus urinae TaxID=1376 RepID=A0A2I1L5D3_9LACT|nr:MULTISPECIES: hypothetical protein [Aerococcus]MCY3067702.1 hypothetical protein [Aerococcus mictus]MCY3080397.1 hypothetical protein [Aerococcus mictus]MDK6728495.1 hypothetical protein [Aerococcus urinae]MDK7910511.1 hypothetical protein [Aerococcus urinae]MDK8610861.1 hypothetical protein [Aerococcus urinae]